MVEAGITHDIVLAGQGYMLAGAGAYSRTIALGQALPKGVAASGQYRQVAWRRRAVEGADGEAVWAAFGFLPAHGGGVLQIAPAGALDNGVATAASAYGGAAELAGVQYAAAGLVLYKITTSAGAYSALAAAATATATITDVTRHKAKLWAALGTKYATWDGTTWTETATAADRVASYAGVLLRSVGEALYWSRDDGATWVQVQTHELGTINRLLAGDGALYIGADRGLFRLSGRLRAGNPSTAPTVLDVFEYEVAPLLGWAASADAARYLVAYGGALWYERGGRLWSYRGGRTVSARGGREEPAPVLGQCRGLAVAGPYLAASVYTVEDGYWLWIHDGEGWWVLATGDSGSAMYTAPFGVAGVSDAHLAAWGDGTRHVTRWNLVPSSRVWATGQAAPSVLLPGLDGGAPEVDKQWTRVGIELGAPEGPLALAGSPATWLLDYSTDGGNAWTNALSLTPAALVASKEVALSVSARRLWLRARVTGGGASNPYLRSIWARWSAGVVSAARRRWELRIRASDQAVTLQGHGEDREARAIAAALSALVGAGAVTLQDRRYATDAAEVYTVAVVEVEEMARQGREPVSGEGAVRVVVEEL